MFVYTVALFCEWCCSWRKDYNEFPVCRPADIVGDFPSVKEAMGGKGKDGEAVVPAYRLGIRQRNPGENLTFIEKILSTNIFSFFF